jgi:biopolymer transport protein TolR
MPAVMQRAQIGRRRRSRPLSEINVTPFVDVMLVLLIVFMVTAPLLTVGVPVDLPKTKAQPLSQDREPLTLSVRRDGSIYLQNTRISEDDLVPRLNAIAANGYDQRVFVRGDKAVDYGRVMQVMALVSAAGFTHIGLVTDVARPPSENDRNKK